MVVEKICIGIRKLLTIVLLLNMEEANGGRAIPITLEGFSSSSVIPSLEKDREKPTLLAHGEWNAIQDLSGPSVKSTSAVTNKNVKRKNTKIEIE